MVALHPDQATDAAVSAAARRGLPFAVVPCCLYAAEFPHRRQFWKFDPEASRARVRTPAAHRAYLAALARLYGCGDLKEATLDLVGRNVVLYSLGGRVGNDAASAEWPEIVVDRVAAFVADADLVAGALRVARAWRFCERRALKGRVQGIARLLRSRGLDVRVAPIAREAADRGIGRDGRVPADAVRCRNVRETRAALRGAFPRDAVARAAASSLHSAFLGPAFASANALLVERAGLTVAWPAPPP